MLTNGQYCVVNDSTCSSFYIIHLFILCLLLCINFCAFGTVLFIILLDVSVHYSAQCQ